MTLIDKAEALAPCPFCGGEARKRKDASHSAAWFIGCDDGDRDCFGSFHWAETEADAIAAWNRRAALPARGVGAKPSLSIRDWAAPDHDYRPSMDPDDQGDCVECGNSASWHNPPALAPTDAAQAREAAARLLLDMLYMQNGAHEGVSKEDAQKMWDAASTRDGYAAVDAFLRSIIGEPRP